MKKNSKNVINSKFIKNLDEKVNYKIYKIVTKRNFVLGGNIEYMAFSKEKLNPEFIVEKIMNLEFINNIDFTSSLEKEIGVDSGYVFHVSFEKSAIRTHKTKIRRIFSEEIKMGKIGSINSTEDIPFTWPGWWGEGFEGDVRLDTTQEFLVMSEN